MYIFIPAEPNDDTTHSPGGGTFPFCAPRDEMEIKDRFFVLKFQ